MLTPVNRSGHATKPRRSWNSARGDAEIAGPSCTGEGGLIAGSSFSLYKEGVFGPPWEGPWPRHWKVLVKRDTCEERGGLGSPFPPLSERAPLQQGPNNGEGVQLRASSWVKGHGRRFWEVSEGQEAILSL
jgi:hypothetical protein